MASRLKRTGKTITVSGNISPMNSVEIIQRIVPDKIDTGMFIIGLSDSSKVWTGVKKCLLLEKELLTKMNENCSYRPGVLESFIKNADCRMEQIPEKTTYIKIANKIIK
jgi:hypothetical protein